MYLKFLLIYSYIIVNCAECAILSASLPRLNYGTNIEPQYRAPAFNSTGNLTPAQNNFGNIKPGVNKPINSFTGNIAVNAPSKPVNTWPNVNTYPNAPPRPSVWNPVPAFKPVVQNDWPYAKQPAYNPYFKVVSHTPPPRPVVQKDRPYVEQQPYNSNFNVPQQPKLIRDEPAILYPHTTPRPVVQSRWPPYNPHSNTTPKPVVRNDWQYAKQPAYNPYFKVVSPTPPPTSTSANRNIAPNQRQPPYNPHFKELSGQTLQNNGLTKPPSSTIQNHLSNPKQSPYNPHFKLPPIPIPANRNLGPSQKQPPYSSHFQKVSGPTTLNQGTMQRQPHQNPLMPERKSHDQNSISTLSPFMTTGQQSKNDHGKNVASKFTKNHHSTNGKQTFENPILLSIEDSEDKFPIKDLINSYSPKDSDPFSSRQSLQKAVISNKLPAVHRHNLETKHIYKGKPFILVTIVLSSVVAMTALTGGIIFYFKKKN